MSSIRSISHYIFNLFLFACIATTAVAQERYLLWGDTHQHSGLSFDVYLFGTVAATPDIAYNYAKGKPVISPVTGNRWQIQSPLDFMVLADHAELMGAFHRLYSGDKAVGKTKSGKAMLELGGAQTDSELLDVYKLVVSAATGSGANDYGLSAVDLTRDMHAGDARKPTWNAVIDAAERHNQPGQFTTFIGWEWSSLPKGANLHRVVFTPQGGDIARQFLPYSQMESTDPQKFVENHFLSVYKKSP